MQDYGEITTKAPRHKDLNLGVLVVHKTVTGKKETIVMRFSKWVVLLVSLILFHAPGVWADTWDLDFLQYKEGECDLNKAEAQAREMSGWTTITLAVLNNDIPRTKALLETGADVNTTDTFHRSLLLLACMHDLDDMARFLVERGADVNKAVENAAVFRMEGDYYCSPVTDAIERNDVEMADYLLKKGATLDLSCGEKSPLGRAICKGNVEAVRFLMEHGAAPQTEDNTRAILRLAFERGNRNVMQYLHEKYTRDGKDLTAILGMPPLHFAVKLRRLEIAEYFLSAGASLDQAGPEGRTLLTQAVQADFNPLSQTEKPEAWVEVLRFLVKKGADLTPTHPANRLLLSDAIAAGNHPAVQYLLDNGYNAKQAIQTRDEGTTLPLVYAVLKGQVDCASVLVKAGADPQYKSGKGQSLLDLARKKKNSRIIAYFEDLLQVKPEARRPSLEIKKEKKSLFTSRSFDKDSTEAVQINLNQYKVEEETVSTRRGEKEEWEKRKVYYYLILKNIPEPILMDASDLYETGGRDPYCKVENLKLEWLRKGSLLLVTWMNMRAGSGAGSSQMTLLLLVQGKQIQTVFHDEFEEYLRNGSQSRYRGKEEWCVAPKLSDIVLTRIETHENIGGDKIKKYLLGRVHYEEDVFSTYCSLNSIRNVYRLQIEGTKVNCVSAKKYLLMGNELPLVNIAASNGISYTRLCALNPNQRGRVFCNGTLFLGETDPFKPSLLFMRQIFPRDGEWGY